MVHAQLNLVLLLLITGIWVAARTRRDKFAGILLGIATAIKLFPGFLFLYFVFRRNWKVVGWGTGSLVLISIFTVVILGLETFNDYVNDGIKGALEWKSAPGNMSLPGMWNKLFDPGQKRLSVLLVPVFQSSLVATIGSIITTGLFVVILAKVIPAAQSQSECDMAFALDVVAMLLVTPITWNHYCLLLILPLALLADRVRRFELTRNLLWFILLVLFISEWALTDHLMVLLAANRDSAVGWVSPPWVTMLVLSTHVYALAGLFGLCLFFRRDGQPSVKEAVPIIPF